MERTLNPASPASGFPLLIPVVACILAVISNTAPLVFLSIAPSATWFLSLTYYYAARVGIPILLMVFGYALLDRHDSYRQVIARLVQVGCCLLLFYTAWYLANLIAGNSTGLSLRVYAKNFLRMPIAAYRPLYAYMGLIVVLPFLQKLAAAMEKRDFHVLFLLLGGVCGLWPIVGHYIPKLPFAADTLLPLFGGCIGMMLAGCYARRYFVPSKKRCAVSVAGFAVLCLLNVGLTYLEYVRTGGRDYMFLENITCLPIMAAAFCLFRFLLDVKLCKGLQKCATFLAPLTFGIYMVSGVAAHAFRVCYYILLSGGVHPLIAVVLFQIILFALGAGAAWIMKKLPVLKKLV